MTNARQSLSPKEVLYASVIMVLLFVTIILLPYIVGRLTPLGMTLQSGVILIRLTIPLLVLVLVLILLRPDWK